MLLIVGSRVFHRTTIHGIFHCSRCGGDRPYQRRSGRRWLTVLGLPLVPRQPAGEDVRCGTCRTRYTPGVLRVPTAAQMQAALPAGLRAAVSVMLRADQAPGPAARHRAIQAVAAAGLPGYDQVMLNGDLTLALGTIRPALKEVGAQLAAPAREWYLADVIRIGMADGSLTEGERQAAVAIGLDLGMTQAQVAGVIAATEQSAGRG